MTYLLDVNALVALGLVEHEFYQRVTNWVASVVAAGDSELATCSITEIAFVRILAQNPQYGLTTPQARDMLLRLTSGSRWKFSFLSDDQDISSLPKWVTNPKQITDGHLLQLAKSKGSILATLDRRIPGAFLIPQT